MLIVSPNVNSLINIPVNNSDEIIVFDRGINDRLIWFRRLLNKNEITEKDFDELINQYKEYIDLVNCLLCFTASPDVSLKRDYVSSLALEKRSFLTTENIETYNSAMQDLIDDEVIKNYYLVNTDDQTLTNSSIKAANYILKKMKK